MSIFWNQVNMDPKRQFRFVLRFPTAVKGMKIPEYVIKTVTKPKITISSIPHSYIDHEFKFPGRVTWDPISLTLVDPGGKDAANDMAVSIMNKLGWSGYQYPVGPEVAKITLSKEQASTAVGEVEIVQLDSGGKETEVWTLKSPFLTSIDFGSLDYSSDELSEITLELTYDWATLNDTPSQQPAMSKPTHAI